MDSFIKQVAVSQCTKMKIFFLSIVKLRNQQNISSVSVSHGNSIMSKLLMQDFALSCRSSTNHLLGALCSSALLHLTQLFQRVVPFNFCKYFLQQIPFLWIYIYIYIMFPPPELVIQLQHPSTNLFQGAEIKEKRLVQGHSYLHTVFQIFIKCNCPRHQSGA